MERWVSQVAGDEARRRIASAMVEHGGLITVDSLTRLLADDDDREAVRLNLYHRHLPKLDDAGVVDYDWRSGDVVLTVDEERLRTVLEPFDDDAGQLLQAG